MTVHNQVSSASVQCGACGASSDQNAKFCEGCGHSLYESCVNCAQAVLLTQKFCGACGADLEKALREQQERHERWMSEAVAAARDYDFDHGISLLRRVAKLQDYRFADAASNATQAIDKIQTLQQQAVRSVNEALAKTKQALDAGNTPEVVRLLQSIPKRMMSEEANQILARVKSFTDEVAALEAEVRPAIDRKDWRLVGGLLDQLLDLAPDEKTYQQLAQQVAQRLIVLARGLLESGKYDKAIDYLDSVPRIRSQQEYAELRASVDTLHWLSQQFDAEPFATPMLGRLAVRFAKETPNDQEAQKLVRQIAATLKEAPRGPRTHLPKWRADAEGWMGGQVGVLSMPTAVDLGSFEPLQKFPGRFNVAIGLALQGLGLGRVTEQFLPKQGLFKSLGRRKESTCWGLDVGTSTLKAVLLEINQEGDVSVIDSFFHEFETPTCRALSAASESDSVAAALQQFVDKCDRDEKMPPVWANLPNSKLISRFVRLPPVKDKAAAAMVEQEIEQKIPVDKDQLAIVRWMAEWDESSTHGRPAFLCTARTDFVQDRVTLFQNAGIELAGLQADNVALVNFAVKEFSELLARDNASEGDAFDDVAKDDSKTPAIVILDFGASATSVAVLSQEAHWCWTVEAGGEELTAKLASTTKTTLDEAEKLKRNPAALKSPASGYESVERRQEEIRVRLELAITDALKQDPRFDVVQVWCCGGAHQCHGSIRRLLLAKRSNV